jgi:hypothetical protein
MISTWDGGLAGTVPTGESGASAGLLVLVAALVIGTLVLVLVLVAVETVRRRGQDDADDEDPAEHVLQTPYLDEARRRMHPPQDPAHAHGPADHPDSGPAPRWTAASQDVAWRENGRRDAFPTVVARETEELVRQRQQPATADMPPRVAPGPGPDGAAGVEPDDPAGTAPPEPDAGTGRRKGRRSSVRRTAAERVRLGRTPRGRVRRAPASSGRAGLLRISSGRGPGSQQDADPQTDPQAGAADGRRAKVSVAKLGRHASPAGRAGRRKVPDSSAARVTASDTSVASSRDGAPRAGLAQPSAARVGLQRTSVARAGTASVAAARDTVPDRLPDQVLDLRPQQAVVTQSVRALQAPPAPPREPVAGGAPVTAVEAAAPAPSQVTMVGAEAPRLLVPGPPSVSPPPAPPPEVASPDSPPDVDRRVPEPAEVPLVRLTVASLRCAQEVSATRRRLLALRPAEEPATVAAPEMESIAARVCLLSLIPVLLLARALSPDWPGDGSLSPGGLVGLAAFVLLAVTGSVWTWRVTAPPYLQYPHRERARLRGIARDASMWEQVAVRLAAGVAPMSAWAAAGGGRGDIAAPEPARLTIDEAVVAITSLRTGIERRPGRLEGQVSTVTVLPFLTCLVPAVVLAVLV